MTSLSKGVYAPTGVCTPTGWSLVPFQAFKYFSHLKWVYTPSRFSDNHNYLHGLSPKLVGEVFDTIKKMRAEIGLTILHLLNILTIPRKHFWVVPFPLRISMRGHLKAQSPH